MGLCLRRTYFLSLALLFLPFTLVAVTTSLDTNGLALTAPPMGVSTWSIFRGDINHTLIVDLADTMVSNLGLKESGYTYLLMDAGWTTNQPHCGTSCLPNRNESGHLLVDKVKFPNLTETIAHVHSKGLLFGIWFGVEMCADTNDDDIALSSSSLHNMKEKKKQSNNVVADVDYATLDANFFASIGVDAVKHDNCNDVVPNTTEGIARNFRKYERMSQALNQTGRPILYDVTLQVSKDVRTLPAYDYNYIWSPEPYGRENVQRIANMWWSVPVNKYNCWQCCVHPQENIVPDEDCDNPNKKAAWRGLLPMLDIQDMQTPGWEGHWDWAGSGKGWNHLDELSVCMGKSWYGPGLTPVEQVAQISLWAIVASPLIISVDTRRMQEGDFCHSLVTNSLMIQVHQDELGSPGRPVKKFYAADDDGDQQLIETQVWCRPLSNGAVAAVFFNRSQGNRTISATFTELGLSPSIDTVTSTNVWTNEVMHGVSSPARAESVVPHGVAFLILTPERTRHQSAIK